MKIRSAKVRSIALAFTLIALAAGAGCAKKATVKPDESTVPNAAAADDNSATGDSDSNKAGGLQTIHFPFDSFSLDGEAKKVLKANVDILKAKAGMKIQIEGHCDAKGGIQYNIALGEKRANATKKYVEDMGIAGDRVTTISFGKERPVDNGSSDEANARNRRANFVITSK